MITITKTYRVEITPESTPPFNYQFEDVSGNNCVTFTPQSGTTSASNSHTIDVIFTFPTTDCITEADIKLRVTDQAGCVKTLDIPVSDPCATLDTTAITVSGNTTFSTFTSGGTPGYTYVWTWDRSVWIQSSPQGETFINLTLRDKDPLPLSTPISVLVTDSAGCTYTRTYNYVFCKPEALPASVPMFCDPTTNTYLSLAFTLNVEPCRGGCEIDWTTVSIFGISSPLISIVQVSPGTNLFIATGTALLPPGTYTASYTVKDACGIKSTTGTITLTLEDACITGDIFTIVNEDVTIMCDEGYIVGDDIIIYLGDNIIPPIYEPNIDWTTFQFTSCGCQTTTTGAGCDIVFNPATKEVTYTICDLGIMDGFMWSVCDNFGNCATSHAQVNINLDCDDPPTTVDDDVCDSVCDEPIVIDLLANDLPNGAWNYMSLMIVTPPSNGTVIVNSTPYNGTVTYTANPGFSGTDTFTYKVANTTGLFSDPPATVTVEVVCAGTTGASTVCS